MPGASVDTTSFQRSPKASTLLREPLLRGSAQQVSVRLPPRAGPQQRGFWAGLKQTADNFRALPKEVGVVLLIDFLNSYRSFGFRSVQYQYMVDEFGLSDMDTAYYLGVQAWLLVIFGMLGAVLVDAYGVRSSAIASLAVAVVSRAVLTFGRSQQALIFALLALAPFGEAVLSTGIYTVALKKLTTPATRGFAFGVQYGVFNLAGALADVAADALRTQDYTAPSWLPWVGGTALTGMRVHLLGTWLAVLLSLAVAVPLLHDVVIFPLHEPSSSLAAGQDGEGGDAAFTSSPTPVSFFEARELEEIRANASERQLRAGFVVIPDPRLRRGRGRGRRRAGAGGGGLSDECDCEPRAWAAAAAAAARRGWGSLLELVSLRVFWRALWCSTCLFWISKQWGDLDQLLPAFLERQYGEGVPIYRIHSINTWVCMLGPSLAAALTSHLEPFRVMLPGLWLMALAPLPLVLAPSVAAAAAWVVLMSVGEVFWSPRQSAWVAGLAPDGREGVFLALLSLKSLITTIPSTAFNGLLNDRFMPDCRTCRDRLGHFCDTAAPLRQAAASAAASMAAPATAAARAFGTAATRAATGAFVGAASMPIDVGLACASSGELCVGDGFNPRLHATAANASALMCPTSCAKCPGWQGDAVTMWFIVLATSLSSPIMVALTLRFLRGERGCAAAAGTQSEASPARGGAEQPVLRLRGLSHEGAADRSVHGAATKKIALPR